MIGWGFADWRNARGERKPCPMKVHNQGSRGAIPASIIIKSFIA